MKLLLIGLLLVSTSLFAKGERFEEGKKIALESVDKKLSNLQELKSCIGSAADRAAMKKCRSGHKEAMKNLRQDRKEKRKSMKEEFKKKRKERKSKSE